MTLQYDEDTCYMAIYSKNSIITIKSNAVDYDMLHSLYGDLNLRFAKWSEMLPDDFISDDYKQLNPDIINLNSEWLKLHYYLYGKVEGRLYKA